MYLVRHKGQRIVAVISTYPFLYFLIHKKHQPRLTKIHLSLYLTKTYQYYLGYSSFYFHLIGLLHSSCQTVVLQLLIFFLSEAIPDHKGRYEKL